jgi:hypothetical protein
VGPIVRSLEVQFDFEPRARLHEPPVVEIRLDIGKAIWVDFIDRHMDMQMIGIGMHGGKPLMIRKANGGAELILDVSQLIRFGTLAGWKGNDEVVCLIGLGTGIPGLGCLDFRNRHRGVLGFAIRDPHRPHFRSAMHGIEHIVGGPRPGRRIASSLRSEHVLGEPREVRSAGGIS